MLYREPSYHTWPILLSWFFSYKRDDFVYGYSKAVRKLFESRSIIHEQLMNNFLMANE
jgi:hypothetical protein